jgi:protease-4
VVDAETVVERRQLRRRLSLWRLLAVLFALLLLVAVTSSGLTSIGTGGVLPHIARVPVHGIITEDRKMYDLLDRVAKSSHVKAVILDVDSPGGTTTGGEALYNAIRRLAEKKPVVAVCGTVAASAAYLATLAADRIFVYGNTVTGSVGVVMQWPDVSQLLASIGVKVEEVKSGALKAVPNPFQSTNPQDRALVEEMVQDAKSWFMKLVSDRRGLQTQAVPGLADGRIYSGRQAVSLKLVDEIGDERAAKSWLEKNRGVTEGLSVIEWKLASESGGVLDWILGSLASAFGHAGQGAAALLGTFGVGLKLDGLISVWHPAGG